MKTSKRFLGLSFIWLLLMALDARSKPNVLLIVTDDQRPDTIAALGNEFIDTPNLDRLVKAPVSRPRMGRRHGLSAKHGD